MVFGFVFLLCLPVPFISPTSKRLSARRDLLLFCSHCLYLFSNGFIMLCVTYAF